MTSFPIPSAGIRPILRDWPLKVDNDLIGSLNIGEEEEADSADHAAEHVKTRLYYDLFVKRVALVYFKRQNRPLLQTPCFPVQVRRLFLHHAPILSMCFHLYKLSLPPT